MEGTSIYIIIPSERSQSEKTAYYFLIQDILEKGNYANEWVLGAAWEGRMSEQDSRASHSDTHTIEPPDGQKELLWTEETGESIMLTQVHWL